MNLRKMQTVRLKDRFGFSTLLITILACLIFMIESVHANCASMIGV